MLVFLLVAAILFLSGATSSLVNAASGEEMLSLFSLGWSAFFLCLLTLPSLVLSFRRLRGKVTSGAPPASGFRSSSLLMLIWPLIILAGSLLARSPELSWKFLPPIQLLGVAIPLWWLVELGRRGLQKNSPQRTWGVINLGIIITPLLIITLEFAALAAVLFAVSVWASSSPALMAQLAMTGQSLSRANMDPEAILRILRPYLQRGDVWFLILAYTAGVVPLLEELFKPLGLWVLVKRGLSPAEGFELGLFCGASFALVETLGSLASSSGAEWTALVIGRVGIGLLHTVTGGLVGWGLATAWSRGRVLLLALVYLAAAGLHGLWNLAGILMGFLPLLPAGKPGNLPTLLGSLAPAVLLVLTVILMGVLVWINRHLRMTDKEGITTSITAALP